MGLELMSYVPPALQLYELQQKLRNLDLIHVYNLGLWVYKMSETTISRHAVMLENMAFREKIQFNSLNIYWILSRSTKVF